jgi:hypothetical protein
MILDPHIVRRRVPRFPEADQDVNKIAHPSHKEDDHQPVNIDDEVVNVFAML